MLARALACVSALTFLMAACGPGTSPSASSAPTAAAAPTTAAAPKPTTAPASAPTTAPTTAAAAAPTAAAKPAPAAAGTTPAAAAQTTPAAPALAITGPAEGEAKSLTGAGSTFAAVLYSKWSDDYNKLTGVQVNYQSIGSGGGIKGIQDQTVDFGATDGPMSDEQIAAAKGGPIFHIPTALGAVVPTYNVPGVTDTLKFTGETLAGIYLGTITKWNDPKLVADNPSLSGVTADIVVVHRSDGSGTSFIWTDYLSTVSPEWQQQVGKATSVNWPVGLGGKGNEGVAGEVSQDPNSIGYVELIYALQNKLGAGQVKNKAGKFVAPSLQGVTAAAAATANSIPADLRASIVDAAGDTVYPISGYTWMLAYKNMTDRSKALALTRWMWWGIHDGQQATGDLGYAPIPPEVTPKSEAFIRQITVDGQPALPAR
jgi:phosphate transport system substrate-binding protein